MLTACKRLQFVRGPGDLLTTGGVVLDKNGPTWRVDLRWSTVTLGWFLTLSLAAGGPIVSDALLRDRVDCLLSVSTPGRPLGALFPYNPNMREDPDETAFVEGAAQLLYAPGGLPLGTFSAYVTRVV